MDRILTAVCVVLFFSFCNKQESPPVATVFSTTKITSDGIEVNQKLMDVNLRPLISIKFSAPIDTNSAREEVSLIDNRSNKVQVIYSFTSKDSNVTIIPLQPLNYFSSYLIHVNGNLLSFNNGTVANPGYSTLITKLDPSDKFPRITDTQLLDSVQRRTLSYFWDFGHPVSGMARERNSSGDLVTSGGTGFGIMAIITGVNRGFVTRSEARDRLMKMADFLQTKCTRYHGAFAHWINGASGATIPFSTNDNGGDLVETSYLIQGLLAAREYFNLPDPQESELRTKINDIWESVEWDWYRKNNENALYWHWSTDKGFIMNVRISGWNETLITYILAASSPTHSIPLEVYDQGFARNGAIKNGNVYYNYTLPLGPSRGGPLFFEHYSFLGIDPKGLKDKYADYEVQVRNHTLINYSYCIQNPKNYYGYSDSCWGLTASDNATGYSAHEPNNDLGVISPTAALSSMPYTPAESMGALHYFYYKLGDKTWKQFGFIDAFELNRPWFANSFLAIDQGPIVVMIENYRSGLFWNLMKTCPEVKAGMKKLGFTAPYL
jgi:hypothetical protein